MEEVAVMFPADILLQSEFLERMHLSCDGLFLKVAYNKVEKHTIYVNVSRA